MIIFLSVKNLAIIENLEIDFKDKMTVLTGETGTGKTLIIDAISYLLVKKLQKISFVQGKTRQKSKASLPIVQSCLKKIKIFWCRH